MARVCEVCGKRTESGAQIARRGLPKKKGGIGLRITGHTLRKFKPNIQRVRALVDGVPTRIKVCTRCLKAGKVVKPAS
jgi:large subunit ribosomal protein L28